MKDCYRPRGRLAHPGHLNKTGQAWKEHTVKACWIGRGKMYGKEIELAEDHIGCPACGEVIRYDEHGYAFCQCKIWNSGIQEYKISEVAKQVRYSKMKRACMA